MNDRQEINKQILAALLELNSKFPDLRFGQLMACVNMESVPFYEESAATLARLSEAVARLEGK